ncbi:zinc finger protein 1 homolog [Teleopsis dalmanni]|uniref:zinc finger protein 1 homolog n=1 Tax=Teleopsis dalmanni TaxID=139649 RepID=UPI0018CEE017|nr:zinc finger protein 1 homolog [Teleopsis dalmanni]
MMKSIQRSCCCGYIKSKCAEIHYQKSSFKILCILCDLSTLNYIEFLEHFREQHLTEFIKTFKNTNEPASKPNNNNDENNTKINPNDPLELEEQIVEKDSNNFLETELDSFLEATLEVNNCIKYDNNEVLNNDSEENEANSDLKLETTLISPVEQKSKINYNTQCDLLSFDDDCLQMISAHNEDSLDNVASIDSSKLAECNEDIDWNKPYAPTLLKNHEKRPYKPRNKPNVCMYCGRTFRRRYQLDTHLNIHTGKKPHQCDICGRLFRAVTTLTRHLNTHEQRNKFSCQFCRKVFTHKAAHLSHELRHTQQRSIPCDECEKIFYTTNQMDTHKRKVHNKVDDDDLPFACDLCKNRYRSASMLSTHKLKKHYKTAKFICEQCDKKFINEQLLENHKLIHIAKLTKS